MNPLDVESLWKDPVFEVGQSILCRNSSSYHFLTEGSIYTVVSYSPRRLDQNNAFTWPAYVQVVGDDGKKLTCHASRFTSINP